MKKPALIFLFFTVTVIIYAQINESPLVSLKGRVLEGIKMKSEMLGYDVNYAIYLPPGYGETTRLYPVVYLLHGFTDDESAWIQYGEVHLSADQAIADREIPPMILVMPDAKVTWYINEYMQKNPYEDMIFKEFIPYIENHYRIRKEKEFRAVAGLSMGGYGSLVWSLHHPEMFTACAAYSAAVWTDTEILEMEPERYNNYFRNIFTEENAKNRLSSHWKKNSVLNLMETLPVDSIEQVRFFIDCGDDDFLFEGNSSLHVLMRKRSIYHEYRVKDGAHNWSYWRNNITQGLKFIGKSFHR